MSESSLESLNLKLGRRVDLATELDPIPRALNRAGLPQVAMYGYDLWNAYEVSFLLPSGKPTAAHIQVHYDADSSHMVESKSFKLFLNAQNDQVYASREVFGDMVKARLSECVQSEVGLSFVAGTQAVYALPGFCVDAVDVPVKVYSYEPALLEADEATGDFTYHSHLFRSNCPVTGQPDWGSALITCRNGKRLTAASMLAYLVSFRRHQGFHEACCELIYHDLMRALQPEYLEVRLFFTRRGGLDINPCRSTAPHPKVLAYPIWRQ